MPTRRATRSVPHTGPGFFSSTMVDAVGSTDPDHYSLAGSVLREFEWLPRFAMSFRMIPGISRKVREAQPMIDASDLVQEGCYFGLFYHDKDLRIPDIQTLIYIGKNLYSADEETVRDSWFFQDPESFLKHGPANKKPLHPECKVHRFDNETLFSVYDWKGLIDELSENRNAKAKGETFN